jgi:hypothetical protein
LPDELYRPGKKARCSQCGTVFSMPGTPKENSPDPAPGYGETAPPLSAPSKPAPRKFVPALMALVGILLLAMLGYGGYLVFNTFTLTLPDTVAEEGGAAPDPARQDHEKRINSISLEEIRQFLVDNATIGKVIVIQGVAVNISDGNKDLITIQARILDDANNPLDEVQQICGVPLTLFQLQSLTATELKENLDNRITILTNNTNVPPGGRVPFVVFFANPSTKMRTFEVRVIDVRDSPPQ